EVRRTLYDPQVDRLAEQRHCAAAVFCRGIFCGAVHRTSADTGVKKEHDKKLIASHLMPVGGLLKGNLSVPMTDYRNTPNMGGRLMHWKAPSIELEPTSLHLLHAGVRLSFGFAIDFSEAGVDAHSKYSGIGGNTHCNDILSAMMEHFTPLAGGRPMHVYGYGKEGSDCFSLQGPMQPFTLTSAQVVPAYNTMLPKVKRSKEYGGLLGLTKEETLHADGVTADPGGAVYHSRQGLRRLPSCLA
ncbi:hypothetical protein CYMTET_31366, partial [Cymbomonas tetramitiformis]